MFLDNFRLIVLTFMHIQIFRAVVKQQLKSYVKKVRESNIYYYSTSIIQVQNHSGKQTVRLIQSFILGSQQLSEH